MPSASKTSCAETVFSTVLRKSVLTALWFRPQPISTVVYLKLPYEEVEQRLGDLNARGVTLQPGQTLRDLYEERTPLYEKYADLIIDCSRKMLRDVVAEIAERYKKQS